MNDASIAAIVSRTYGTTRAEVDDEAGEERELGVAIDGGVEQLAAVAAGVRHARDLAVEDVAEHRPRGERDREAEPAERERDAGAEAEHARGPRQHVRRDARGG